MHKCSLDASVHLVKLPRMALPTMMCQDICPYLCAFSSGPCLNWWWWWRPSSVVQQARDKCPLSHRRPHCYNHPCDGGHFAPRSLVLPRTFTFSTFSRLLCRPVSFSPSSPSPHFFHLFCVAALFRGRTFSPHSLWAATYTFPTGSLRRSNITKLWTSLWSEIVIIVHSCGQSSSPCCQDEFVRTLCPVVPNPPAPSLLMRTS